MPRGDRTGPNGMGPRSGRGLGFCNGYSVAGYVQDDAGAGVDGRGGGRGLGRGPGRGSRAGGGRGFGCGFGRVGGRGRGLGRGGGQGFVQRWAGMPVVAPDTEPLPGDLPEVDLTAMQQQLNLLQQRVTELTDLLARTTPAVTEVVAEPSADTK